MTLHQPEVVDQVNNNQVDPAKVSINNNSREVVERTSTPRIRGIPIPRTSGTKVMNLWISCLGLSLVMSLVSPPFSP